MVKMRDVKKWLLFLSAVAMAMGMLGACSNLFSTTVSPPTANAGSDQAVQVGSTARLNGSSSSGQSISYSWTLLSYPTGSGASISNSSSVSASLIPDFSGDYLVRLVVSNSGGSACDLVKITASAYVPTTALLITPSVLSSGSVGTPYSFTLSASGIPSGTSSVTFAWNFGDGGSNSSGTTSALVTNGSASTNISHTYTSASSYTLSATVGTTTSSFASASAPITISSAATTTTATLTLTPASVSNGTIGTAYSFTLTATGLSGGITSVTFNYNFGDGSSNGTGTKVAYVYGGSATASISHSYGTSGIYGLSATISNGSTSLASALGTIAIGSAATNRNDALTQNGVWHAAQSGGDGVTVDIWDISSLPSGAKVDLKYEMYSIPDRCIIEYPTGTIIYDSGWRGDVSYNGDPQYPGGVTGDGTNQISNLFSKGSSSSFKVTIVGGEPGTAWDYSMMSHW